MRLLIRLKNLDSLTASEQVLADYILRFPNEVIHYSPNELAAHSFVSVSTIYRLLNKLHLDGLTDLKLALVNELDDQLDGEVPVNIDYPISAEDTQYEVNQKLKAVYEQAIDSTIEINSLEALNQHTHLLHEAVHVDIYASSANIYFAQNFQFQLQEIGKRIAVPIDDYTQNLSASNSTPDHLAIVVSYEGRGASVKKILHLLKDNGSKILLITAKTSPLLTEDVDGVCLLPALENHYNKISSFATRTSLMYLFDQLYLAYFNQDYQEHLAYKLATYKKMNPRLE